MLALSSLLLAAVRELDQAAFNEIEESPLPAFLKLDPPNCAACHLFNPFWASWADAANNMGLEGRVWRVFSNNLSQAPEEPGLSQAPGESARSRGRSPPS